METIVKSFTDEKIEQITLPLIKEKLLADDMESRL
jgi:hypothetical protein